MDIFNKDTQEFLVKAGRPVLLIGEHGVGKTTVLRSIADNFNLKMHELNAATLDPFVHLVGIPVTAGERVVLTPPKELEEAEILFIDEVNRADRPSRNALFEIICDHSVNGKKLENLKLVVAAMNPPDGKYQVDALDQAMDDRFLFRFKVDRDISHALKHTKSEEQAEAVKTWYSALGEPPSPRRLTWTLEAAIGEDGTVNEAVILNALDDTLYGSKSLLQMLNTAAKGPEQFVEDNLLTEDEQLVIANLIVLAINSDNYAKEDALKMALVKKSLREMFIKDGETYLPTPDGQLKREHVELASKSEQVKRIDAMFPYSFSQRTSFDWTTLPKDGTWLNGVLA